MEGEAPIAKEEKKPVMTEEDSIIINVNDGVFIQTRFFFKSETRLPFPIRLFISCSLGRQQHHVQSEEDHQDAKDLQGLRPESRKRPQQLPLHVRWKPHW